MTTASSILLALGWISALLFFVGIVLIPAWLLVIGRRIRSRSRRMRGAFWGGVAGHFLGDVLFIAAMITPPLVWPPEQPLWDLALVLLVPPAVGMGIGAIIGRRRPRRYG